MMRPGAVTLLVGLVLTVAACNDDFLDTVPIDRISDTQSCGCASSHTVSWLPSISVHVVQIAPSSMV